jgi:hypothetical protein
MGAGGVNMAVGPHPTLPQRGREFTSEGVQ